MQPMHRWMKATLGEFNTEVKNACQWLPGVDRVSNDGYYETTQLQSVVEDREISVSVRESPNEGHWVECTADDPYFRLCGVKVASEKLHEVLGVFVAVFNVCANFDLV